MPGRLVSSDPALNYREHKLPPTFSPSLEVCTVIRALVELVWRSNTVRTLNRDGSSPDV